MAGKPEDISDEAWDAAEACFPGNSWNPLTVERVARAIMAAAAAEREACAVLIEENQETIREEPTGSERHMSPRKTGNMSGIGFAAAIRKRGEA